MTNWRQTTLGELEIESVGTIQTGPFGSQLHASDYSEVGVPVVMPTNIRDLRISESGIARVSSDHVERLARHRLRPGDIVYSRRGDVEKCALVTGHSRAGCAVRDVYWSGSEEPRSIRDSCPTLCPSGKPAHGSAVMQLERPCRTSILRYFERCRFRCHR